MAKRLMWNHRYRTRNYRSHIAYPSSLSVENWRIISVGHIYANNIGTIEGLFIHTACTYFAPGLPLSKLTSFLDSKSEAMEQFFLGVTDYDLYLCYRCKGSGVLDWVSRVTSGQDYPFIRDKNMIYLYKNKRDKEWDLRQIYFAKAALEKGFIHCPDCNGFGIELDARRKLLTGMPGIKKSLVEFSTKDIFHKIEMKEFITKGEKHGNF